MSQERVREIVRQFPENSMKLLLHDPANVRDLLSLAEFSLLARLRLEQMQVDQTNYISADYRHVSSDLVLTVPLRPPAGSRRKRELGLTFLMEHQSDPDRLILVRIVDYLAQIWKAQARAWSQKHGSFASAKLRPVLPVVFYTGTYRWERLGTLLDLMDLDSELQEVLLERTPMLKPLFVNLPELPADQIADRGGFLGQVLRLVQARKGRPRTFRELLGEVVAGLEPMADEQRLRWLELLSYVQAMVYHDRPAGEHEELEERILTSVRKDSYRKEFSMAQRTIRQMFHDEGRQEGRREEAARTLRNQLERRFGPLPPAVQQTIEATRDLSRLEDWLDRFATATTLAEVGIPTQP